MLQEKLRRTEIHIQEVKTEMEALEVCLSYAHPYNSPTHPHRRISPDLSGLKTIG